MAKTEYRPEEIKVVQEEVFVLTLSPDEAKTLKAVLGCVGGNDEVGGHRNRVNDIYYSMKEVERIDTNFIRSGMFIKSDD